ncbi:hypothetical protein GCM10010203_49020 [Actinomadura yumaensis]
MSWEQVKLGDIFEIARSGSPRPIDQYITDDPNGLNWISIKDASWTAPSILDMRPPHFEAVSNASGLIPSRCE